MGLGCNVWVLVLSSPPSSLARTQNLVVAQFSLSLQRAQPTVCRTGKLDSQASSLTPGYHRPAIWEIYRLPGVPTLLQPICSLDHPGVPEEAWLLLLPLLDLPRPEPEPQPGEPVHWAVAAAAGETP